MNHVKSRSRSSLPAGRPVVVVREPWECAQGQFPGALPIPLKLLAEHLVDIPDGDTVYVICASGNRSLRGARILRSLRRNAVLARGGMTPWTAQNRPIQT
ncbi:Sulfurtransferase [Mycolicibacterium vanbaalenii]|uniref:Sulfurtransferase n=1 Tax=Mycolicibacterium vanbaalenii TaxID=110539 RepID=A0A5S9QU36_MYCVN|nr:rhodanese-like domain-containing protein [Mycolicibacterium vanbaalenii]CAA0123220.1 Sulfurtransferase [Mycolicibacterium vanbaalenii]